jgi:hypothetical protein
MEICPKFNLRTKFCPKALWPSSWWRGVVVIVSAYGTEGREFEFRKGGAFNVKLICIVIVWV